PPYPALDLVSRLTYAPILTSRGCPFSCSYCASSFLESQMRQRSPESVFDEIRQWHEKYGVFNFAFYDDALLINPEKHIIPLLEKILEYSLKNQSMPHSKFFMTNSNQSMPNSELPMSNANQSMPNSNLSIQNDKPYIHPLSFHTPNALHIRQITRNVADMMFKTGFQTIRLGLETTDFSTSRKEDIKVRQDEFYHAVAMLKQAGFKKEQIGAYLLCALPYQNLDDVEHSIMLVNQAGIMPVLAYYTPIPHTRMWKKALACSEFDLENNPLLTNNALLPCLNKKEDIKRISELKKMTR
ncbi:MAG: radical SAM protein, partial [Desulfamplus sp.]|nr:radical SAM protein [Desulfamplus sp.]